MEHSTLDCEPSEPVVDTRGLRKCYGDFVALEDCTLAVHPGEVFGLLGPNGAGKTTLLRTLLGFLKPSGGRATVNGFDCERESVRVRQTVAYLPGEARLFRQMRGRDVLRFFAEMRPSGRLGPSLALAERFELDVNCRVGFMSTGMRQKLALAATLAADTPLIILDEPTANLDPTVRATILELVAERKAAGHTVLFSSHVLAEVEEACDRVVILQRGRVVHFQPMAELRRRHRISIELKGQLPEIPEQLTSAIAVVHRADGRVILDAAGRLPPVLEWLASVPLTDVSIESVGLRPIFERYHARPATPELA